MATSPRIFPTLKIGRLTCVVKPTVVLETGSFPLGRSHTPLIRRRRNLEQLLKACQVDDDDDFDVRMGIMGPCIMLHAIIILLHSLSYIPKHLVEAKNCIVYHDLIKSSSLYLQDRMAPSLSRSLPRLSSVTSYN